VTLAVALFSMAESAILLIDDLSLMHVSHVVLCQNHARYDQQRDQGREQRRYTAIRAQVAAKIVKLELGFMPSCAVQAAFAGEKADIAGVPTRRDSGQRAPTRTGQSALLP